MAMPAQQQVVLNPAHHRFELPIEDEAIAASYYRLDDAGRYVLIHTEVPDGYSGQGIASRLAHGIFEMARTQGFRLVLKCPFMISWFARHPEYADVVDD